MNLQYIFISFTSSLIVSAVVLNDLDSLVTTSLETAAIVKALKEKDYVLVLLKIIDLKFKIDPPEDHSRAKFWLLLSKKILTKIHPYYRRIQQIKKSIRGAAQEMRQQILNGPHGLKRCVSYVQKQIVKIIPTLNISNDETGNYNADEADTDDISLVASTVGLFGQLANNILNTAEVAFADSGNADIIQDAVSAVSPKNEKDNRKINDTLAVEKTYTFENKTKQLTINIEANLKLLYAQLQIKSYIYYSEEMYVFP